MYCLLGKVGFDFGVVGRFGVVLACFPFAQVCSVLWRGSIGTGNGNVDLVLFYEWLHYVSCVVIGWNEKVAFKGRWFL